MNPAHLHLLLNHFPTVGFGIGLGLFLVSLALKSNDLRQAGLVVFIAMALLSLPAYLSGNAAHFTIKNEPDLSESLIAVHQDAALLGLIFMQFTGLLSWFELWRTRHVSRPIRWNLPAVLVLSLVTFGAMARAANIGGEVRHPEIRAAAEAASWPKTAVMAAAFVIDNPWVWPIAETFHFVGLSLLFGFVLMVNLRTLGVIRNVSFTAMYRLLPWGILGFAINFISGMLFFIAVPDQYTQNTGFYWKMGMILLAAVTVLYPTVSEKMAALKPEENAPLEARVIAASSILLWTVVIFLGRYLPYIGSE